MRDKKAFTLMELLTVIAVMAVLAGLLLPALNRARARARIAAAESMLASLQVALSMYNMEYGVYPASSESGGLNAQQYNGNSFDTEFNGTPNNLVAALTAMTKGGPYMEFRGRDLDESGGDYVVLDPWGRAYVYTARLALDENEIREGNTNPHGPFYPDTDDPLNNTYNIYSLGPDGVTHDGTGSRGFTGTTWHVDELVQNEECGDWRSAVNESDPRYDDINSWDGARR
jgi:prepilin-type N-terminal cleavage/methylation domain-containing protein